MAKRDVRPAAFMSYARADDTYNHLTTFRERLSQEVRIQTGEAFPIFQDKDDIQLGQKWKDRIEGSLDEAVAAAALALPTDQCPSELRSRRLSV